MKVSIRGTGDWRLAAGGTPGVPATFYSCAPRIKPEPRRVWMRGA